MDNFVRRGNQSGLGLNQCASKLPPGVLWKLGVQLSSKDMVDGPCWEIVADELNFDSEARASIRVSAENKKVSEGFTLLRTWTYYSDPSHTLLVLKHALEKCNRPDIMTTFNEGIEEMNYMTLNVEFDVDKRIPDSTARPQLMKVNIPILDTLGVALRDHINTEDYDIDRPTWATWRTRAGDVKGKQITLVKRYTEETSLKEVEDRHQGAAIMDGEVSSTRKDIDFVPNIPSSTSLKILNTDNQPDTTMPPFGELDEELYMSMTGSATSTSNNFSFKELVSPLSGMESICLNNPSPESFTGSFKRPHPCEQSDEDNLEECGPKLVMMDHSDTSVHFPFPSSSPINVPGFSESNRRNTVMSLVSEPRLPDPDIEDKKPLMRSASAPDWPQSKRSWKRVRSQVFIPRANKSFQKHNLKGWHGLLTMEKMEQMLRKYSHENGWYVIWIYHGDTEQDNKLVISVTHDGKLLHYNIRARVIDGYINYYLYKNVYITRKVVHLIDFYTQNSLEKPESGVQARDVKLLHPMLEQIN